MRFTLTGILFSFAASCTSAQAAQSNTTFDGLTPLELVSTCAGLSVALISTAGSDADLVEDHVARFATLSRGTMDLSERGEDPQERISATQALINDAAKQHQMRIDTQDPALKIDIRACEALAEALEDNPDLLQASDQT